MLGTSGARLLLAAGRRLRSVPAAVSPQKRDFPGLFVRGRDADNKAQVLDNFVTLHRPERHSVIKSITYYVDVRECKNILLIPECLN